MAHVVTRIVQTTRLTAPIRAQTFLIISNISLRLIDLTGSSYDDGAILNYLRVENHHPWNHGEISRADFRNKSYRLTIQHTMQNRNISSRLEVRI
jgi:hypothetical protein